MHALFAWLAANPLVLLFSVVLGAVLVGKARIWGCGLGIAGSAILVGAALSAIAATHDVRLSIDPVVRALFLCLFMYGLGLRLGPSLAAAFRGDGRRFTALAVLCCVAGLATAIAAATLLGLPAGAIAGILAGSMTHTAAIGAAEQAIQHGAFAIPIGTSRDELGNTVALAYAVSYMCGAMGFAVLARLLPRWWGVDLRADARRHEEALGVPHIDEAHITSLHPLAVRAFRLSHDTLAGWTLGQVRRKYPQYKVLNVLRTEPVRREPALLEPAVAADPQPLALAAVGVQSFTRLREPETAPAGRARRERVGPREASYLKLGAADTLVLRQGDVVTLGARPEELSHGLALIGPEVSDPTALNVPLDQAEIVITNRALVGRELGELRDADFAGQVAVHHMERGGVPIPLGLHVKLQRMDVLFATGVASAVEKLGNLAGRVARPCAATDLLTLSAGLVLGLLLGAIAVPIGPGASAGLGTAGGLLLAGLLVSSLAAPLRVFGQTPKAARGLLEDLGLAAFAAIVAIDAGTALVAPHHSELVGRLLLASFATCVVPPIVAWAVGYHVLKLNPAVLIGALAGARSQEDCARGTALEVGSSVPWIGFPVAYAVSGILLTALGYAAMALA